MSKENKEIVANENVWPAEAHQARLQHVGAGTQMTAPDVEYEEEMSGLPIRKVVASTITGLVIYGLSFVFDVVPAPVEQAATVVGMVAAAYITPNLPTPGGVPYK